MPVIMEPEAAPAPPVIQRGRDLRSALNSRAARRGAALRSLLGPARRKHAGPYPSTCQTPNHTRGVFMVYLLTANQAFDRCPGP